MKKGASCITLPRTFAFRLPVARDTRTKRAYFKADHSNRTKSEKELQPNLNEGTKCILNLSFVIFRVSLFGLKLCVE